jgi:hypothetical protein
MPGTSWRSRGGLIPSVLLAALLCGGAAGAAATANAATDHWVCNSYYSAQRCYAGTGYRSYVEVTNSMGARKSEVCAKGVTAAGNVRSGSGCNHNTIGRVSCFSGASPHSAAYVYWAGSGGPAGVIGDARTPSSRTYC